MTARGEWFLTQEELQAPTDDECKAITARVTPAARSRFNEAASALSIAKIKSGDRTPWRELVEAHRKTLPVQVETEVVNDEGMPRVQVAYIERGYGLKGNDALMFNAVSELARAIELIEKERERNSMNGRGTPEKPGGRPLVEGVTSESIAAWLKNRSYADSLNKKGLVRDAMDHFDVRKTKVTDAISRHGLARKRARKSNGKQG